MVAQTANEFARRYGKYGLDRDDLIQQQWMWVADHPRQIQRWLDEEPEHWDRKLARALRNELHDYGEKVKADAVGYSIEDLQWYSKKMLGPLLTAMFNPTAWIYPEKGEEVGRRAPSDPALGGDWMATLADVSRAFDKLESRDQVVLKMFYEEPVWLNKDAAAYAKVSEQVMSYRHDAALGRLLKHLGGHRPRAPHDEHCDHPYRSWAPGRHAMSNAAARAQQDSYWESE